MKKPDRRDESQPIRLPGAWLTGGEYSGGEPPVEMVINNCPEMEIWGMDNPGTSLCRQLGLDR